MVSREPLLLIVAADRRELTGVVRRAAAFGRLDIGARWSRLGALAGGGVVLAANGAGRANAARAVEQACQRLPVRAVVSAGWCAGLDEALWPGQVVIAERVVSLDPPAQYPARSPAGQVARRGEVLTVDRFVQTAEEKQELRRQGALAVEMEAAGVAAEAQKRNLPFYCVRAVSDGARRSFRIDYNRARLSDGRFSAFRIAALAGLSPARWRELLDFWREARSAAEALGEYLGSCSFDG